MANIRHHFTIKAPIKKVYDALTLEEGLKGWWTDDTSAKHELGNINHFKFGSEYFNKMKVLELNFPSNVSWECVDGDKEWIGTKLAFELEEKEGDTYLKFSHLNWADESEFFGFCNYHWGRFLYSLKSLCETGIGQPYKQE
ncbi:SRPBCC domain-containing protein [Flavivirga aquimarina]|uniref:SRPBCC domain-containing protein n=1 Tax=Flavivirga aquimarina TaxID=2027862 RepID=A0ABT8WAF6_9FLAO|nr:SRPBCC domain-containing protein [Flavivirga aquimarina]MDO5970129.1 SRPBCC domain-containing protein [Flavivirga aquimarina]